MVRLVAKQFLKKAAGAIGIHRKGSSFNRYQQKIMLRNTCEKAANGCEMLRTVFPCQNPIGLSRGKNYGIHSWAFIFSKKMRNVANCEM
jgi:hypothetical protein